MKSVILLSFLFLSSAFASDHIDGPITTEHAVSDITDFYAYPSRDKSGFLTVILNTYPFVPTNGHFSDKIDYQILVREATLGDIVETKSGVDITCRFETPYDHDKHIVECSSSNGISTKATVNKIDSLQTSPLHVFAGNRSDPFFANVDWAKAVGKGSIPAPKSENSSDKLNVLSIVLEIDLKALLGSAHSNIIALAAQTLTEGKRLDRIGRPEITNVSLLAREKKELRDDYNKVAPFEESISLLAPFETRLSNNITFYDGLDKRKDWNDVAKKKLISLLIRDFLVIDLKKTCTGDHFLEIEKAMVAGKEHVSCGGRRPEDDIMDNLISYYINADTAPVHKDGVDKPYAPIGQKFPYLAGPDTSLLARLKALMARKFFSL